MNFFMHILSPIFLVAFVVLGVSSIVFEGNGAWGAVFAIGFLVLMVVIRRTRLGTAVLTFIYYQLILFVAILLALAGRSLHIWPKIESIRDEGRWLSFDTQAREL